MKRVALLNFPINDVGGINSWCDNFWEGLITLGYEVGHYYLSPQTRFGCDPENYVHKRRYSLLPAEFLSTSPEAIDDTIKDLNSNFDIFVFIHPSPHPTKAVLSRRGHRNWIRLYEELVGRKIVVFHDEKWRRTNDWFEEVQGTCDLAVAAQHRFLPSVDDWANGSCKTMWEYFPMPTVQEPVWRDHRHRGIVFTQWIQWKNHLKFLPLLDEIEVPFELYGGGIIYHNAKADGEFDGRVWDKSVGEKQKGERHTYHGFIPYTEIMQQLRRSRLAIDLSTRGYTNMSHWEPLWQGTPNFVERRVGLDSFCELPLELCEIYDLDDSLPERINSFEPDIDKLVQGQIWMAENCGNVAVTERIMEQCLS